MALCANNMGKMLNQFSRTGAEEIKFRLIYRCWNRVSHMKRFSEDLFIALLPARLTILNTLRLFDTMLLKASRADKFMEILHQLVQRLDFVHHENVVIETGISSGVFVIDIILYKNDVCTWKEPHYLYIPLLLARKKIWYKIDVVYLFSVMLSELQISMTSAPSDIVSQVPYIPINTYPWRLTLTEADAAYLQALEDLWSNLCKQDNVKSLLRLCIMCVRKSMHSLHDKSFLNLPIPPYIRKLLMYRDVSDTIYKEFCEVVRRYERPISWKVMDETTKEGK